MKHWEKVTITVMLIFLFLIILFPASISTFSHWWSNQQHIQECLEKNIYAAEPVRYDKQFKTIKITYMICKPEISEKELKAQIDQFLQENDIVATLLEESEISHITLISLCFICPTDDFPVGKIETKYDEGVTFSGERRLCSITIDWAAGGTYQYEFFPENFEAKE